MVNNVIVTYYNDPQPGRFAVVIRSQQGVRQQAVINAAAKAALQAAGKLLP